MELRRWKYEDILPISQLEKECFPDEPWSFSALASSFSSSAFRGVVACEGDEIIGYGGVTVAADSADVDNIAVAEDYRRGGVASAILSELENISKDSGAKKMFLEVRVSNSAAMSLYLKHGFCGAYARTRYYSNGEDCIVMAKEL